MCTSSCRDVSKNFIYMMAKSRCLRRSQCAIEKYGHHILSGIMSDDRVSIVGNHHDFTMSANLYFLCYYNYGHHSFFKKVVSVQKSCF